MLVPNVCAEMSPPCLSNQFDTAFIVLWFIYYCSKRKSISVICIWICIFFIHLSIYHICLTLISSLSHIHMHVWTLSFTHSNIYEHTHAYMHTNYLFYTHTYAYTLFARKHVHTHAQVYPCSLARAWTYSYARTHTRTCIKSNPPPYHTDKKGLLNTMLRWFILCLILLHIYSAYLFSTEDVKDKSYFTATMLH